MKSEIPVYTFASVKYEKDVFRTMRYSRIHRFSDKITEMGVLIFKETIIVYLVKRFWVKLRNKFYTFYVYIWLPLLIRPTRRWRCFGVSVNNSQAPIILRHYNARQHTSSRATEDHCKTWSLNRFHTLHIIPLIPRLAICILLLYSRDTYLVGNRKSLQYSACAMHCIDEFEWLLLTVVVHRSTHYVYTHPLW